MIALISGVVVVVVSTVLATRINKWLDGKEKELTDKKEYK